MTKTYNAVKFQAFTERKPDKRIGTKFKKKIIVISKKSLIIAMIYDWNF